jgi:hypothetical protein
VNVTDPIRAAAGERANANPKLIGINFSGGMASVVSQLNAALGASNLISSPILPVRRCRCSVNGGGHDRQFGLRHHHGVVVDQRQPAAAVVHRRRFGLHRRDHRQPARK